MTQGTIRVYGTPSPKGSKNAYRRGSRIILVESAGKALKDWEEAVRTEAHKLQYQVSTAPFSVHVEFIMPRTKAMKNNPPPHMTQRPDIDKLARGTFDPLSGIIWKDDSQIIHLHTVKRRANHGEETGAIITFKELT